MKNILQDQGPVLFFQAFWLDAKIIQPIKMLKNAQRKIYTLKSL